VAVRDNVRFVADFFSEFLESRLNDGQLTTRRYHRLLEQIEADAGRLAQKLFRRGNSYAKYRDSVYTLRYLREPNRRLFPFILAVPRKSGRRAIKCFVGHRFTKAVVWSLRYNLKHLFEPYRIDLDWSGDDLAAIDIFTDVVRRIREADMCIFDNLGTLNKPNVYIEIGIAHGLGRPMIVCEYEGRAYRRTTLGTGTVPTDLAALLTVRYRDYNHLCRQLYFKLPRFLERHRLV
jgi:hypothetical protein